MCDPSGEYTYICSAGPRRSIVMYFTNGTPRQHRYDGDCFRPDMLATVKKPGTDSSLQSNRVEGALFTSELRSGRMGGNRTIYWMIDPKWHNDRPEAGQRVGWATTVIGGAPPGDNGWNMVPVRAAGCWNLGTDKNTREKVVARYYFQNDYGRSQPLKPCLLDVPGGRPRARSETRYTVVQTQTWDRERSRDRSTSRVREFVDDDEYSIIRD